MQNIVRKWTKILKLTEKILNRIINSECGAWFWYIQSSKHSLFRNLVQTTMFCSLRMLAHQSNSMESLRFVSPFAFIVGRCHSQNAMENFRVFSATNPILLVKLNGFVRTILASVHEKCFSDQNEFRRKPILFCVDKFIMNKFGGKESDCISMRMLTVRRTKICSNWLHTLLRHLTPTKKKKLEPLSIMQTHESLGYLVALKMVDLIYLLKA